MVTLPLWSESPHSPNIEKKIVLVLRETNVVLKCKLDRNFAKKIKKIKKIPKWTYSQELSWGLVLGMTFIYLLEHAWGLKLLLLLLLLL